MTAITEMKQLANPPRKPAKKPGQGVAAGGLGGPADGEAADLGRARPDPHPEAQGALGLNSTAPGHGDAPPLVGEFVGKEGQPGAQAPVSLRPVPDEDEAVVERVEHLNRSVGWMLISAGVVGIIVPGVLGTPFLIMGALALWPGNHKRVERWRQGHSPKMFHGAMRQVNRFLDDLEKRYPHIGK
jgi:hypothetical protein